MGKGKKGRVITLHAENTGPGWESGGQNFGERRRQGVCGWKAGRDFSYAEERKGGREERLITRRTKWSGGLIVRGKTIFPQGKPVRWRGGKKKGGRKESDNALLNGEKGRGVQTRRCTRKRLLLRRWRD